MSRRSLWACKCALLVAFLTFGTAFGQNLQVWTSWAVVNDFVNDVGKDFSADNPGVTVESTLFPQRALEARLATSLIAGEAPDLIIIGTISLWEYWELGLLEPLPSQYVEWARETFVAPAIADVSDHGGTMVGLPFIYYIQGMYYNTAHLEDAGLAEPPSSFEELREYARRLTVREGDTVRRQGINIRLAGGGYGLAEKFWAQTMLPYGASPLVETNGKWRAAFNSEAGIDAVNAYLQLLYEDRSATYDLQGDAEGFSLGTSSMFMRESWVGSFLQQGNPELQYQTSLMPPGPAGWGTQAGTLGIVVPSASRNHAPAFAFAEYLNNPENALELTRTTGWMTARYPQDVDYGSIAEELPGIDSFVAALDTEGYELVGYPRIPPILEIMTRFSERLAVAFQDPNLLDDRAAIGQLLDEATAEANRVLADWDLLAE